MHSSGHAPAFKHLAPSAALGDEPPLAVDGSVRRGIERRGVNVRWFSGTVLTGLCGAGLMGGAVWAALENPTRPATPAEILQPLVRTTSAGDRPTNTARKGDRLTRLADVFSTSKQTIRVSQTSRVGDREIIRVRPHTRVVANLVQTSSGEFDIPEFNPLRMLAGDAPERAEQEDIADGDGEVTIRTRDIAAVPAADRPMLALSTEEILAKVREVSLQPDVATRMALPVSTGSERAPARQEALNQDGPNIMRVAKRAAEPATPSSAPPDRAAIAKPGDTITALMLELGATRDDARLVATAFNRGGQEITLREGQRIRVLFAPGAAGRIQPVRIMLVGERDNAEAAVALSDDGRYVAMEDPADAATVADDSEEEDGAGLRLYNAIYETALRQEIPKSIVDELIRLFGNDVDFNRRVGSNDLFEVLYSSEDESEAGRADIVYASLTTGGETRRYYRFHSTADNLIDFYDENGRSARKFLIRKPIAGGQMRSGFGMRRHPVMGYYKMHSGVDWADRVGTPIVAAGNGIIGKASWSGGYGRRVEIEHPNGYTSTYSHMSGFARGITEGARVRQGQVIGYLGSSGLSTGPHLHYEVMVNGRFVDPMRVRVPRGRELGGQMLAVFRAERERIDNLMTRDRAETRVTAQTAR